MSFINEKNKEITCKVAYFGAPFSGKSTSLKKVFEKTTAGKKEDTLTLTDETDGSLFFDFLPLSLGKVNGYTVRFHLYTVPGQSVYDTSRKLILKGTDGVIFVVDSRMEKLDQSLESWKQLKSLMGNQEVDFQKFPIALQFNKRDLPNVLPLEELHTLFNDKNFPEFETVAKKGENIMECFQSVAKQVLLGLKK